LLYNKKKRLMNGGKEKMEFQMKSGNNLSSLKRTIIWSKFKKWRNKMNPGKFLIKCSKIITAFSKTDQLLTYDNPRNKNFVFKDFSSGEM
jgi:hypothetical protein